jgi:hypothetical protein
LSDQSLDDESSGEDEEDEEDEKAEEEDDGRALFSCAEPFSSTMRWIRNCDSFAGETRTGVGANLVDAGETIVSRMIVNNAVVMDENMLQHRHRDPVCYASAS